MKNRSFLIEVISFLLVAIACLGLTSIAPILAQDTPTAPITIDGRRLFEVNEAKFSADKRAREANIILEEAVKNPQTPTLVEVDTSQSLPVIRVNNEHLLTVTAKDTPDERSVEQQAQIWRRELEKAIADAQYERTTRYFIQAGLISFAWITVAIALSWGVGWFWKRKLKPLLDRLLANANPEEETVTHQTNLEIVAQIIIAIIRLAIGIGTLIYISDLFIQTRQLSRQGVRFFSRSFGVVENSVTSQLIPLGDNAYSVLDLFILFGLFAGLIYVSRIVKRLLRSRILRYTGLNRAAQETITIIANYAFIFIGTIVVLQVWGLDLSSLTVFAGVLGVGIGLGLQGVAKEFISGLVLIFDRPIQVGDFVEVGDLMGTVERISVRSTEIRTLDQVSIILPNSRFLEQEVVNWNHHSSVSRLKLPVGVAYGSDLTTVRSALIDATKNHPDIIENPQPKVFFRGFGDSSLDFDLLVWIKEPQKQFQIKSDLYFRIEAILRNRSVEIPFPQRDLHVRSGSLPVEVSPELIASLTQLSTSLASWLQHQSNGGKSHNRDSNNIHSSKNDSSQKNN
ncbi:MAG: mechanosensitive ion channel [Oscillatoria sp. PMC 1051.18]|nr:mechanosensitive ion channel [Oscillatoria sp. PMC 1050.18]MEC5032685.1 mechanosensitive ion channel [Oscillatoria sp. PMC 1051.18]